MGLKKIFLSLELLYCMIGHAQSKYFTVGVEGGPNLTSIRGISLKQYEESAIQYWGGISLQYRLNSRVAFKAILSYERKTTHSNSYSEEINNQNGNSGYWDFNDGWDVYFNRNYICLPLMVTRYGGDKRHFFIQAGPYLGLMLNAKVQVIEEFGRKSIEFKIDYTDEKRLDFGACMGMGWELPMSDKLNVLFGLRHNIGFYNISRIVTEKEMISSTNLFFGVNYKLGK